MEPAPWARSQSAHLAEKLSLPGVVYAPRTDHRVRTPTRSTKDPIAAATIFHQDRRRGGRRRLGRGPGPRASYAGGSTDRLGLAINAVRWPAPAGGGSKGVGRPERTTGPGWGKRRRRD